MTDLVTNSFGRTDAYGKGNLAVLLRQVADDTNVKALYTKKFNMDPAEWLKLFSTNIIYKDVNNTFTPVGSIVNSQSTIKNDNVDLITAEVVLQLMKRLENSIQTTRTVYTQYEKLMAKFKEGVDKKIYHILNPNSYGTPQINLFNEYIINQILATRVKRRYVIIEDDGQQWMALSGVQIFDHAGGEKNITEEQVVTSSLLHNNHTYGRHHLVDGYIPGTISECWHSNPSNSSFGSDYRRRTLVPYSDRQKHHIIIDLGEPTNIGKIIVHSRNQAAMYHSDNHYVYLTDHLYWRQTSTSPVDSSSRLSVFKDTNANWIYDPYNPVPGQGPTGNRWLASTTGHAGGEWVDHPTPWQGGQSVFTYVFDGDLDIAFKKYSSYEFVVNVVVDDNVCIYLNGDRMTPTSIYGHEHGSWKIPSSILVQGKPGINRFDFVVQNSGGPAGLLATVDYKTVVPTLKQYQYVYVQLDSPTEVGMWSEIRVFDENNALLTPIGGMVAPFDGTSSLHHDDNFLTFSNTNDYATMVASYILSTEPEIKQIGLDIDGKNAYDRSGYSVSINSDGTIVAIGSPGNDDGGINAGHTRVYQYTNNVWTQLGGDIKGENAGDRSGWSVSLNNAGTIVAIGAKYNNGNGYRTGHARIYQWQGGVWTQLGSDIDGESQYDYSGFGVSLSGDGTTVAIGSPLASSRHGHVRIYKYASNAWTQLGANIDGESAYDYSGRDNGVVLSDDGTIVAIGAPSAYDGNGVRTGHTRIYKYASNVWTQLGADIDGEASFDGFGSGVSLSGDGTTVAIGAPSAYDGNGVRTGHTRIYKYASNAWTQLGTDIDGKNAGDFSGQSVSLSSDGTTVAIGALYTGVGKQRHSGHTRIYKYASSAWTQFGVDFDGESRYDYSGQSVSLSGDGTTVAIGAQYNDGHLNVRPDSGHTRVYKIRPAYESVHKSFLESTKFERSSTQGAWAMVDLGGIHTISKVELHGVPNSIYTTSISPISSHKVYLKGSDSTSSEIIQMKSSSSTASVSTINDTVVDTVAQTSTIISYKHAVATYDVTNIIGNSLFESMDYSTTHLNSYRYVVVQIEAIDNYANWGEIQAFNASGVLLPVTNSVLSSHYHSSTPSTKLHDGNPATYAHTSNQNTTINGLTGGPWMMIDLGSPQQIATVKIFARQGEWGTDEGSHGAATRTHPHRVFLTTTFNNNDVNSVNTLLMSSRSGLGVPFTDRSLPAAQRQAIYTYDVIKAASTWNHAFSTGDNEWTMSEPHRSMIGSDTIQLPAMSAQHTETSDRKYRQAIYDFPSSSDDPIIDMGSSPVSFTVEFLTKYQYVIVQIDHADYANWSVIEAYDENEQVIPVIDSVFSSVYYKDGSYGPSNHSDSDYSTFSHTAASAATLNGVRRGPWVMLNLGAAYTISKVVVVSRPDGRFIPGTQYQNRTTPHRIFLTDTFINSEVGDNTLELVNEQATLTLPYDAGRKLQAVYTYKITGTWPQEHTWKISQDTDNQVVAYRNYTHLSTNDSIPTETFQLAPEHLGYTGAYTLTMYDTYGDGWNQHWNMKVTSTNAHGRTTIRAVTQGPYETDTVAPTGTRKVLRMHLSGDTTPIRDHPSSGPAVIQLGLTRQEVYQNKLNHLKLILKNESGTYTKSRNHILGEYNTAMTIPSHNQSIAAPPFFWNMPGTGSAAPGAIGADISNSKTSSYNMVLHDMMNEIYNIYFNNDEDISMYELQPSNDATNDPTADIYIGSNISTNNTKTVTLPALYMTVNPTPLNDMNAGGMYHTFFQDTEAVFSITVNGDQLTVTRTDQNKGWAQNLVLRATYDVIPDIPTHRSFSDNKILFTSRLGSTVRDQMESLAHYMNSPYMFRNGISVSQYASEIAVEMLQNSSLKLFANSDLTALSELPMSCGYALITDTTDANNVLNVRIYVSHVIDHPFIPGKQIAISSGVNLFDLVDIKKFSKGVSSSNFITQLTETIQTINSDPLANFNETEYTTWEYGTPTKYNSLLCISSPDAPYWNGKLIKDCQIRGSTEDVPSRIFFILDYINTQYTELYDNQFIIINDINGVGKVVSIIKITIADDGKTTFQCRDSHIDNLFPIANVNADMVVNGELQVANYTGDVLMHIDPVTDKTMLMGKMGINQEMHDINAMLDIDNLSNKNLLDFTTRFMPLILDSVVKMDTFITYNPYNDTSLPLVQGKYQPITTTATDKTAAILDLKVYSSIPPTVEPTRELRFGTLQARVELPVRIYAVTQAYKVLHSIDDKKSKLLNYIDRLKAAKSKKETEEAEAKVWGAIIEAAFSVATSFLPGIGGLLVAIVMKAADFDISDFVEDSVSGSSEEIQDKIDQSRTLVGSFSSARSAQQTIVNGLMADMQTQAGLLGLSALYDSLLLWQTRLTIALRMYTIRVMYVSTTINDWIKMVCSSLTVSASTPSFSSFTGAGFDADTKRYSGKQWVFSPIFNTWAGLGAAIDKHSNDFVNANKYGMNGSSNETIVRNGLADRVKALLLDNSESMINTPRQVYNFWTGTEETRQELGYISTFQRRNESGDATIAVLHNMREELNGLSSNDQLVIPFLSKYIKNAEEQVEVANINIRSGETSDIVKSTKVILTPEDTSQQEFEAAQELLDAKRADLATAERRLAACNWVIGMNPPGAHEAAGDHRRINDGYIQGWRASKPHGWILYETSIFNQTNYKLNNISSVLRSGAEREKAKALLVVKALKDFINEVDTAQSGLMDNLQEYTSSHDWTVETHNRLKHLISDIYKMYLNHGSTMNRSKLNYTCILPVTTKSDNMTSAMYIKMVLALEDDQPQVSLSGRLLDVTEYTRDLSYKETLMQLMQGFFSGSQLINYGAVLLVKYDLEINDEKTKLITDIIREDGVFNDRFGSTSLYLVIDNLSESKIVQHERYAHWNDKEFSTLFYPNTTTRVSTSYKTMNDTFITHYGFDPFTTAIDNPLLSNMYMIPHKYDDVWKMVMVRYVVIAHTRYRVSCVIDVVDYIDQSIITKGDSTFHGDFTVKSSDNREIFQIDTLNNTSANLYPLSIGAQQPRTMLDVQDASIMDINYFITKISKGMRELTAGYTATTAILANTDDYKYKYRFNMDTKLAEDTIVVFHELYPKWINRKYSEIMEIDKDRAYIIQNSILPALQKVIDNTQFYVGSIYSTRIEFTSGMKYSVHKIVKINVPIENAVAGGADSYNYVEAIGQGWDIQTYGINIITNPNVLKLIDNLDANIEYINFIRYKTNNDTFGGPIDTPLNVQAITDKYRSIEKDVYKYDLKNVTSVLDQKVSSAQVSDTYDIEIKSSPISISNITNKEERIYHTSFIVDYTKDYDGVNNRLIEGDFGIIPCRDSNYYYYAMFYKLREQIIDTTIDIDGNQTTRTVTTITNDSHETVTFTVSITVTVTDTVTTTSAESGGTPSETVTVTSTSNGGTETVTVTVTVTASGGTETVTKTVTSNTTTTITTHTIGDITPSATSSRVSSVAVFFVNMTKDHITPSMSIEGDLAVAGELTMSGLTTRQNAASIYLTVDPENRFVGINSNDRFANYSLKHTSEALGSIYDTSQHLYVKNDRYPNATFARIAEITEPSTSERDYDATKDYTLFGTYSAATMLRCSDIWTYAQAQERADHYTTSLANINTTDWQKKKRYGTDIAFEIKDVSGVTTELGEVQMVIDSIDMAGNLHAGFGVQVVDRTLGTIFPQALKNIMYVNNDSELFVNGVMLGTRLLRVNPNNPDELLWGDIKVTP